jgi:hypothetical protein
MDSSKQAEGGLKMKGNHVLLLHTTVFNSLIMELNPILCFHFYFSRTAGQPCPAAGEWKGKGERE